MKKILLILVALLTVSMLLTACDLKWGSDQTNSGSSQATSSDDVSEHTHSFGEWTVSADATCESSGAKVRTCNCGETETEQISAKGHSFENYVYNDDATCDADGTKTAECANGCGKTDTVSAEGTAIQHSFVNYVYNNNAACGVDGTKTAVCANGCGKTDTVSVAGTALQHSFITYVSNNDATCTQDGTKTALCENGCGTKDTVADVGTAKGHSFVTYVSDNNATCTQDGTKTALCENACGTKDTVADVGTAKGHSFVTYVSDNNATCTQDGTKTALCERSCGTKDTVADVGTAKGHSFLTYVSDNNATCTQDGTKTALCERSCGTKDTVADTGTAKGHKFTNYVSDEETVSCTTPITNTAVCDNGCGTNDVKTSAPRGHIGLADDDVCDSCRNYVQPAYTEGLKFTISSSSTHYSVTGYEGSDSNIVIPRSYQQIPVTIIGEKAFFNCDNIVSVELPDTIVEILDKAFSDCDSLVTISVPDDVELGTDVFRGTIHIEIVVRHPLVFVPAKDATCTEAGNTAYYWCETCDMFYSDSEGEHRIYEVLIPSSHKFVGNTCELCGKVRNEVLITYIDSVAHLGTFPLGTLEGAIGLPASINVRTADGRTHTVSVAWDLSSYNKAVAGEYTISGILQSGQFYYSDGLSNRISTSVKISAQMVGTADIVFILDISGSMGDEISNVKNNLQAFAQAIEDKGVSARWSVVTYSDFTYSSAYNEQTHFVMNGASEWYTSAGDCKNAIGSISLANGGDWEEAAVDGLMKAYTASTRNDARVFYILVTDADYKNDNNHGVAGMYEAKQIFVDESINVSVVTSTSLYSDYSPLKQTGGIQSNIYGDFANDLLNALVPIIYDEVIQ